MNIPGTVNHSDREFNPLADSDFNEEREHNSRLDSDFNIEMGLFNRCPFRVVHHT